MNAEGLKSIAMTVRSARAAFRSGSPVTVASVATDAAGSHAYACVRLVDGRAEERAPGRGERWQSAGDSRETQAALALLAGKGKVATGLVALAPIPCAACRELLSAPESIATGLGPTCGGRDGPSPRAAAQRACARMSVVDMATAIAARRATR